MADYLHIIPEAWRHRQTIHSSLYHQAELLIFFFFILMLRAYLNRGDVDIPSGRVQHTYEIP